MELLLKSLLALKAFGFSLIEVTLVGALLGILSIAAVVISVSQPLARLNAAARQVQTDIEYARQNAMMTGVTSGASFVVGGNYTVYQQTSATPLKSPLTKQNMVILLSNNYSNISIASALTVEFNSFGQPSVGGGGSVNISNGSATKTIKVTASTGLVIIQ